VNPNQIQGHTAEGGRATQRLDAWIHSSSVVSSVSFFSPKRAKQWLIWGIEMKKRELLAPKLEVFHGFQ